MAAILTSTFDCKVRILAFNLDRSFCGDIFVLLLVGSALPDSSSLDRSGYRLRTRLKSVCFVERRSCVLLAYVNCLTKMSHLF